MWKSTFFYKNVSILCGDLFQDFKNVIYFCVQQLKIPKIAFRKCDIIAFTCFFHCTVKNKDIALKFRVCVVCMYFDHIAIFQFLITWKFWILYGFIRKVEILNLGVKIKNIKNPRWPFCRAFNFTPFGVFDCVLLQNWTF